MGDHYSGSCLCGAVRFKVTGKFQRFYLCHCEYCRKDTGSAHAANLFSSAATLEWISGQDRVTTFNLPSTRHGRSFCCVCGSALPGVVEGGRMLVVPAGSLDDELGLKPDAHLFVSSRASWDDGFGTVPLMDRFPA